jgi:Arc/MetJ-type ribon-helix-helix transcriptional regulator
MKGYIHARLGKDDAAVLQELKAATGESESQLVRRGLRLVRESMTGRPSALDVARASAGKFKGGPKDLSTNKKHLDGFGR